MPMALWLRLTLALFTLSVVAPAASAGTGAGTESGGLPIARAMIYKNLDDPQPSAVFAVEVAATHETMRQGLMHRQKLAGDAGMLFVYPQDRRARFWMRNTLIPLDMIFIRKNGEIESIVERYDTQSDTASLSRGPVRYVLEINAGLSRQLGITSGHFVRIRGGE